MSSKIKKPCPLCGELYGPLGIMRHRFSAKCKQNYREKYGSAYDRLTITKKGRTTYRYREYKKLVPRNTIPKSELKRLDSDISTS